MVADSGVRSIREKMTNTAFSDELKAFIDKCTWTFAKTYAETWAHEYIVQK